MIWAYGVQSRTVLKKSFLRNAERFAKLLQLLKSLKGTHLLSTKDGDVYILREHLSKSSC